MMMCSTLLSSLFVALAAGLLSLTRCGDNCPPAATAPLATADTAAAPDITKSAANPAPTARYECPMRSEGSQSSQPGRCPVCGMDLEPKKA